MTEHDRLRTVYCMHKMKGLLMVANCSKVRGHLEKLLCVRQIQIFGCMGREVSQLEAPFFCARSIDLRKVVERNCFRVSAVCLQCLRFDQRTSFLAFT